MDWITVSAAFLIAILSGMGVGSAGLLVVYLTMVLGAPQLTAQGINLLFFLPSALIACFFAGIAGISLENTSFLNKRKSDKIRRKSRKNQEKPQDVVV